ncbi:MAG: phosphoribosyl-ATP diphosphatase [Actinomycetes bacterium]
MKTFDQLWAEISDKQAGESGNTGALLAAGIHEIGKKVVEEAAEAWMAAEHESKAETALEISQLLYHAQVLAKAKGLTIEEIYEVL